MKVGRRTLEGELNELGLVGGGRDHVELVHRLQFGRQRLNAATRLHVRRSHRERHRKALVLL